MRGARACSGDADRISGRMSPSPLLAHEARFDIGAHWLITLGSSLLFGLSARALFTGQPLLSFSQGLLFSSWCTTLWAFVLHSVCAHLHYMARATSGHGDPRHAIIAALTFACSAALLFVCRAHTLLTPSEETTYQLQQISFTTGCTALALGCLLACAATPMRMISCGLLAFYVLACLSAILREGPEVEMVMSLSHLLLSAGLLVGCATSSDVVVATELWIAPRRCLERVLYFDHLGSGSTEVVISVDALGIFAYLLVFGFWLQSVFEIAASSLAADAMLWLRQLNPFVWPSYALLSLLHCHSESAGHAASAAVRAASVVLCTCIVLPYFALLVARSDDLAFLGFVFHICAFDSSQALLMHYTLHTMNRSPRYADVWAVCGRCVHHASTSLALEKLFLTTLYLIQVSRMIALLQNWEKAFGTLNMLWFVYTPIINLLKCSVMAGSYRVHCFSFRLNT